MIFFRVFFLCYGERGRLDLPAARCKMEAKKKTERKEMQLWYENFVSVTVVTSHFSSASVI